ncbi:acyltransferase family protein [Saccharothrix saharensis]|uniref:acyltransferase family protein n=1 Tax=Saccharothrix saharensis TaxID=571190 RepID=UPI0036BBFC4F
MTNAPAPAPTVAPLLPARLPSLTGLRFLAAFVVFGFHLHAGGLFAGTGAEGVLAVLLGQGATGVGFFFLLSGFVLTWSAREGLPATVGMRRRAARVLPNHVVVWVVVFAGLAWLGGVSVLSGVLGLFLLQAWVPVQAVYFGVNTPAWSLSCEAAFYTAFAWLLALVDRVPPKRLWAVAIGLMAAVVAVPALALPLPDGLEYWFVYVFPVTRALEFVLGMVLARIVRAGRWLRLAPWQAGTFAVAGYVASGHLPGTFGFVAGTVVPLALLIPAVATADLTGSWSPWRHRAAVFLGEVSFAFYLVHQVVLRAVEAFGPQDATLAAAIGLSAAALGVSLVLAWLLHRLVERPAQRRLLRPTAPA